MKKLLFFLYLLAPICLFSQKAHLVLPIGHVDFIGLGSSLKKILFSKDDKMLITVDSDNKMKIWDVASQRLYEDFDVQSIINDIKISDNGELLYVITDKGFYSIALKKMEFSKAALGAPEGTKYTSCLQKPDGTIYLSTKDNIRSGTIIWQLQTDFKTLTKVAETEDIEGYFTENSLSANGDKLMLVNDSKFSIIFSTTTWQKEKIINVDNTHNDRRMLMRGFSKDGDIIALKNKSTIALLDVNTLAEKTKINIPSGAQVTNPADEVFGFSEAGNTILISNGYFAIGYNKVSGKTSSLLKFPENFLGSSTKVALSNNGKAFALGCLKPKLYNIEGNEIASFGKSVFAASYISSSTDKDQLVFHSFSDKLSRFIKISDDNVKVNSILSEGGTDRSAFSKNGKILAISNKINDIANIDFYDLTKPGFQKTTVGTSAARVDKFFNYAFELYPVFSNDDKYLASLSNDFLTIISVEKKKVILEKRLSKYNISLQADGIFSPNGEEYIFSGKSLGNNVGDTSENTCCINIKRGDLVWSKPYYAFGFKCNPDKNVVAFGDDGKAIITINPNNGDVTSRWPVQKQQYSKISADGETALSYGAFVDCFDIKNKIYRGKIDDPSPTLGDINFLKNKRFAVATDLSNFIHFYDLQNKTEIAKMILFDDTDDWALFTADGRFDASEAALKTMYYVKGNEFIALEALSEKFYTPRLLQSLLSGADIEPAPLVIDDIKAAPKVKISFDNKQRNLTVDDDITTYNTDKQTIELQVQADCPLDAVTEIRLFQNGKLVSTTRNLTVEDDTKGEKTMLKTCSVMLVNGENRFKAIAFNSQRTESKPDEIVINYNGRQITNAGNKAVLYLFVVGLNNYKNPKYNLNYALADATSVADAISNGSQNLFSKVNTTFLKDADADKKGIMAAFEKIQAAAKPEDLFIFYYAGHGVINDKKEFFLVPYDVTQLYGDDDALAQKGMSAEILKEMSKNIKAQKQLFILDACQSAGALVTIASSRGAAEEKAISQLARSTGTHWLTASSSEQYATEFAALGHGLFTYTLLEGLKGGAANSAKQITVNALKAYLETQVPELSEKYKGKPQYPASYGYGNDFPIEILK